MTKKFFALVLIFALTVPLFGSVFAVTDDWAIDSSRIYLTYDGRYMSFRPADQYVSKQNPPNFTWPYPLSDNTEAHKTMVYTLKICSDSAMTDTVFQKDNIKNNYYNLNQTLQTGVDYWWSVQYSYRSTSGTIVSSWSTPLRFRIETGAYEFVPGDTDTMMSKIPLTHPRIWTTQSGIDEFRNLKNTSERAEQVYNSIIADADLYVNSGEIPAEPTTVEEALVKAQIMTNRMMTTSFAYLLTEDEKYGEFAIRLMDAVSDWSYDDQTGVTSYKQQDQAHRDIAYKTAISYDWVYDLITSLKHSKVKAKVLSMIDGRTQKMTHLINDMRKEPYDSHGWTTLGFIGIIGIAMRDELADAGIWAREVIPMYTALLPPWSYEDGGWSQGTYYWQFSMQSGQEFMDILALADIVNLYDTAYMRNSYLWSLYAFPEGSYGSFGEGANRFKPDSRYSGESLHRIAAFTGNPVAKWLALEIGGEPDHLISYSLLAAEGSEETESREPINYSAGHEFKDIGWAVMSSDLADVDRVQLTFKSSPYGSFNHSYEDQNSFIIQAYGKNLAIKSGYYDSYNTPHTNNIARKTFAHNSITTDGYDGQSIYQPTSDRAERFDAKGEICQFVTQMNFDSVTGDATGAYFDSPKGNTKSLDKFVRSIIYIRPDVFITIDDLDAKGDEAAQFKWWLNSEHEMQYTDHSALISEGAARLAAQVVYPSGTTAEYHSGFYDLKGIHYPASGGSGEFKNANEHDRVSFATSAVNKTKMAVVMSVYKENDAAKLPTVEYSADGKCEKLSFEDGTCVLINLTEDNGVVVMDGIKFNGTAVTYNSDSMMLTNGNYLSADGSVLIQSTENLTAAFGMNRICISANQDAKIQVSKTSKYIPVETVGQLADENGDGLSAAIGLTVVKETDNNFTVMAQKGNYSLAAIGTPVSLLDMIPTDLSAYMYAGEIYAEWKQRAGCKYDLMVDGKVIQDVVSGCRLEGIDAESEHTIYARAMIGGTVSDWCEAVPYIPSYAGRYSQILFSTGEENGKPYVEAEVDVNRGNVDAALMFAHFTDERVLSKVEVCELQNGRNSARLSDVKAEDGSIRAYIIDRNTLRPLTSAAIPGSGTTDLSGIFINGKLIDGFDDSKNHYTIDIVDEYSGYVEVKAIPADGTTKSEVKVDPQQMTAEIRLTSAAGLKRKILMDFNISYTNPHRIKGAEASSMFITDTGVNTSAEANGLVSLKNASSIKMTNNSNKSVTGNLPIYFPSRINEGGKLFGMRIAMDRTPNTGNLMEINELSKDLRGWDYIVLPNAFYANESDSGKSKEISFNLAEDAEVVVLTCSPTDTLKNNSGFSYEKGYFGRARYMNQMGAEDVYYNIAYNGGLLSEIQNIDTAKWFTSYDYTEKWLDVTPIAGCSTLQDYEERKPAQSDFTVLGGGERFLQLFEPFRYRYSRIYDVSEDGSEVTIDISDLNWKSNGLKDRTVVIVRPIMPKFR